MASMNRRHSSTTPRSYVVRIYRRTATGLVGQVQDVLTGRVRVFRTAAGLWSAVGGRSAAASSSRRSSKEASR